MKAFCLTPLRAGVGALAVVLAVVLAGPSIARATDPAPPTTAPRVATEAPAPGGQVGAPIPEIGPFVAPVSVSHFSGTWWLVGFGGLQLVGLFVITRRARARLSVPDARS